jgi:glutaredoxin 3
MAAAFIDAELTKAPLVIFSKTTCGYCTQVKDMLATMALPVPAHIVEVNQQDNMSELQDRLLEMTGGRSVPRVFVGGKFIGGCDDTMAAKASGEFEAALKAAGAYGAASGGGDAADAADSTMVLLEQLPANTAHTLAYQMKEALSLDATPLLVKISESSAICYLGSVADAAKAVTAGALTLFQVAVAVKAYSDGSVVVPSVLPSARPMTPAAKPAAAAGG